jgi:hypothetical protein
MAIIVVVKRGVPLLLPDAWLTHERMSVNHLPTLFIYPL